jgi:hypothetical protein
LDHNLARIVNNPGWRSCHAVTQPKANREPRIDRISPLRAFLIVVSVVLASEVSAESELPIPGGQAAAEQGQWRRTVHGWEDSRRWQLDRPPAPPATAVHPCLIGALQLLLSIGALAAFPVAVGTAECRTRNAKPRK